MTDLSPAAEILRDLIRCPSVTPEEGGALSVLEKRLGKLGFNVTRHISTAPNTPNVENLYARLGTESPNLCFAGHTDVVPTGDPESWSEQPFSGAVRDGMMYGRGAVDMKGGIACFLAAAEAYLAENGSPTGSISFLITGDEEGPAINGTSAILGWLVEQGEQIDACVVGEPTNPKVLGDAIKIGRRGSLSGTIKVTGVQGHVAYPHLADNPVRGVVALTEALMARPLDAGTDDFQPSNLEVTSIDAGNLATNVIPQSATARFNVRFNENWSVDKLKAEINSRLAIAASDEKLRRPLESGPRSPVNFETEWNDRPSYVFLTRDDHLIGTLSKSVEAVTGKSPELSTGGGTSDARFIKEVCPVVEFGLVGQTMHQIDERVDLTDLEQLTTIYKTFLSKFFSKIT